MSDKDKGKVFLLKKHGMYYAHNSCGYVDSYRLAEVYTEEDAKLSASQSSGEVMAIDATSVARINEIDETIERLEKIRNALLIIEGEE